jgi:two-component system OmpR family sensor kinase
VLDLPEAPVTTTGDPSRLQQITGNLLANARAHTPAGTRVTVRLRQDDTCTRLMVEDDGPGVPPDILGTVFERFARADHTRSGPEGHGAGLGLAIVHAVAVAHGGSTEVRSRPGRTVFTVTLPGHRPAPE